MLALSPLDRVNKMLTADFPGRQGPCSSFVAAIDVRVWSALRGACDMRSSGHHGMAV